MERHSIPSRAFATVLSGLLAASQGAGAAWAQSVAASAAVPAQAAPGAAAAAAVRLPAGLSLVPSLGHGGASLSGSLAGTPAPTPSLSVRGLTREDGSPALAGPTRTASPSALRGDASSARARARPAAAGSSALDASPVEAGSVRPRDAGSAARTSSADGAPGDAPGPRVLLPSSRSAAEDRVAAPSARSLDEAAPPIVGAARRVWSTTGRPPTDLGSGTPSPDGSVAGQAAARPEASGAAFDGVGFRRPDRPHRPELALDPAPATPAETGVPRLTFDEIRPAAARTQGLWRRALSRISGSVRASELPGNPTDAAGVETALRGLVGAKPELFQGLTPADLETVAAHRAEGREGLADFVYVRFRQTAGGLPVDGTWLNFTVRVSGGRSVIARATAQLFPRLPVDTAGRLSQEQILARAAERVGLPPQGAGELGSLGRRVMHLGGGWRAVEIFILEKKVVMVAVDAATGETFAWDPRVTLQGAEPAPSARGTVPAPRPAAQADPLAATPSGDAARRVGSATAGEAAQGREGRASDSRRGTPGRESDRPGRATGRGIADGPHKADSEPKVLALGHIQIEAGGKTYYADADGRFTVEGEGGSPVRVTVRLSGRYAAVKDSDGKDLSVTVTARPGEVLQAVFNPEGAEEAAVAQVNAYYHTTLIHEWLKSRGLDLSPLNRPMPVNVNINDDCNAYYTPWNPSLNFFKSSERCANSAYNDVIYHEYGHGVDNAAGGITHGGMSEGWGDILAMFITGQPIIGRGFIKVRSPDYIRNGENDYQYNGSDEVHQQGQAWMGFAWKLRKALIASLGDPARAAALAEALVLPVLLAAARDIPAAIQEVLLRDTDAGGNIAHYKQIKEAADAHGIHLRLPDEGDPETQSWWSRVDSRPSFLSRLARAAGLMARGDAAGGLRALAGSDRR